MKQFISIVMTFAFFFTAFPQVLIITNGDYLGSSNYEEEGDPLHQLKLPLQLNLSLDKLEYYIGEKIYFNLSLTNIGNMTYNISELSPFNISFNLSLNNNIFYFPRREDIFWYCLKRNLKPNNTIYYSSNLPIRYFNNSLPKGNDYFLYEPGYYTITATYNNGDYNYNASRSFYMKNKMKISCGNIDYQIIRNTISEIPLDIGLNITYYSPYLYHAKDGRFHMVWEAKGFYDNGTPFWGIGHSSSNNGVHWSEINYINSVTGIDYYRYFTPNLLQDKDGLYWLSYYRNHGPTKGIYVQWSNDLMSWSTPIRVFEGRDPYGSTLFYSNDKLWLFWLDEYGDDDKIYVSSSINGIDWNNQIILNGNFYGPDLDFNINPNGVFKINYWQSGYKTLISESGTSWESYPSDSSTAISNYYSNISLESNSFYWEFKGYNEFSISKNGINWSDPIDMRVRTNNQTCHLQYLFQDNDGTFWILGVYYGLYNEKDEYIPRLVIQSFNIVSWNTPNPADNPSLNNDSLIDGKERRSYFPTFILIIISIIFIILLTIVIIKKRGEES